MNDIKIYDNNEVLSVISNNILLSEAFRYIVNNSSSNNLPYHNIKHCVDVMGMCMTIDNTFDSSLFIAALFHDFNHSGGKLIDEDNIQMAIDGLTDYFYESDYLTEKEQLEAIHIIEATQYPYVIKKEDLSKKQSIIRDADLMVSLYDGFWHMAIFGLMEEMGVDDIYAMISGQIGFHDSIELCNSVSKKMYEDNWIFKDTLNSFNKIFNI